MLDPFGRSQVPPGFSRADRVALLGEAVEALLAGELPSPAARLFLAGGLSSWFRDGGDLLRDFWRIKGEQGSTATAPRIWQRLCEERQDESTPAESRHPNPETPECPTQPAAPAADT